jgi:hypothetical protein
VGPPPSPAPPPATPAPPAAPTPSDTPRPAAKAEPSLAAEGAPPPAAKHEPAPSAAGDRPPKTAPTTKEKPPPAAVEHPSEQDKRSRRARNLLRFTSSKRPEAPEQAPPAGRRGAIDTEIDRLTQSIESVNESLGGQPAEFYERELPQMAASEIATRLEADVIVLLLDNGQGLMEVSGQVGLSPDERQMSVEYSRDVMRELFRAGVGLIEDTDRVRGALTGIPGSQAETLILAPLVHERLGFGVLMAGRARGEAGEMFSETDVEALMGFADGIAPSLRTVVLLRHLKGQLSALQDE